MTRFFVDSSVFFAACYSDQGHARDLFAAAARGDVVLVVSPFVLDETRRVLEDKAPRAVAVLDRLIAVVPLDVVEPTRRQVAAAAKLKTLKDPADEPIVAAARKAKADMLVSFDRKHLVGQPELVQYIRAPIVVPQEAWGRLARAV